VRSISTSCVPRILLAALLVAACCAASFACSGNTETSHTIFRPQSCPSEPWDALLAIHVANFLSACMPCGVLGVRFAEPVTPVIIIILIKFALTCTVISSA
jgi:hypothetical protein